MLVRRRENEEIGKIIQEVKRISGVFWKRDLKIIWYVSADGLKKI